MCYQQILEGGNHNSIQWPVIQWNAAMWGKDHPDSGTSWTVASETEGTFGVLAVPKPMLANLHPTKSNPLARHDELPEEMHRGAPITFSRP